MHEAKGRNIESMPELVILTGMSGAGRTEAMHIFEDIGYYCVDNLPPQLITPLLDLSISATTNRKIKRIALVCDARNGESFSLLKDEITKVRERGVTCEIVFLDANDAKLIARYKSSRRRHPLCDEGTTIVQGIAKERELLYWLKENANYVIDTTDMLPQQLRSSLVSYFSSSEQRQGLAITVYSFGFKHGAPKDADVVIDVRFLPNPFYDSNLKHLTGLDEEVKEYVLYRQETMDFQQRWHALLDTLIPGYVAEGKQQLAIAVGCTGGQHRSVVLAETTGDYLKSLGYRVSVAHRDLSLAQ